MMRCGFCGYEFDPAEAKHGCGGCPGGCHNVHCPRCGYKNPLDVEFLQRLKKMVTSRTTKE